MNTETTEIPAEEHLFSDEEVFNYTEASTGQRFLNYLIDAIFMQYAVGTLTGYALGFLINAIDEDSLYQFFSDENSLSYVASLYFIGLINYLLYYTFCEKIFKGYTLGKLITGTKAIRTDGKELTLRNVTLRTLSRLVPFEPFSVWGDGLWHDRWTGTMVIKTR